jgi:hypothetical protein
MLHLIGGLADANKQRAAKGGAAHQLNMHLWIKSQLTQIT